MRLILNPQKKLLNKKKFERSTDFQNLANNRKLNLKSSESQESASESSAEAVKSDEAPSSTQETSKSEINETSTESERKRKRSSDSPSGSLLNLKNKSVFDGIFIFMLIYIIID